MTRLSVIIPGYNTPEAQWSRCLKSVCAACGPDDEIICVDDGSKTRPAYVNLNLQPQPTVKWIYLEKNSGLPTARNEGLRVAKGEFVTFVDSDDEVRRETFERCLSALGEENEDIAVYGVHVIWINDRLEKFDVLDDAHLGVLKADDVCRIYKACLFDYACNKVYRRSFLDAHGLRFNPDVRTGEDTVFNCQCVMANARYCTVNYIGYVYYRYDGSMLSRYVPNMRETHRWKLETRAACRASRPGLDTLLGGPVRITEEILDHAEWMNMWRRQSPHGYAERWAYLSNHRHLARHGRFLEFVQRIVYGLLRQYCYCRPIRRWNILRQFPAVRERRGL